MNDTAADTFRRARAEVAAALSILMDPASQALSAEPHILDAWRLLRHAATSAEDALDDDTLVAWVRSESRAPHENQREAAAMLVQSMLREAGKPASAREPAGATRDVRQHVRFLGQTIDRFEPEVRGHAGMRMVRLRRAAQVLVFLGLAAAFMYVIRDRSTVGSGPWRADFYPTHTFEGTPLLQRHEEVNFDWGTKPPHERISANKFSVRWDTCLVLSEPSKAKFELTSNDGSRLFVDGEMVIDLITKRTAHRGSANVELEPGVHHLQIDYYEVSGSANVRLRASIDGEKPDSIPTSLLRYPGDTLEPDDPCASSREQTR